jgi:hypothetical protein
LLCGYRGQNFLLEIKNPAKPKADQQLTDRQKPWHDDWRGQVAVVRTIKEAMQVLGVVSK